MIVYGRSQLVGWFTTLLVGTMMPAQGYPDDAAIVPNGVDHLLYASANLEQGMDEIESLLGIRPFRGGHHPRYGTHNALLSLGPGTYLEVIARDPQLPAPKLGALVDVPANAKSRLITWAYRTADIQDSATAASNAGTGLGRIESGTRARPDGSEISWYLTDPYVMPLDGAVPFLINWGGTSHPSIVVPSGGRLVELVIEHPEPDRVRRALSALAADITVIEGAEFRLSARIATTNGLVVLE